MALSHHTINARQKAHRAHPLRVGAPALAALLMVGVVAVLATAALLLTTLMPTAGAQQAQARPELYPQAVEAIRQHMTDERPDPMVEVAPHILARQSNVGGVMVEGVTFYYAMLGHQSFDPLSMGRVAEEQVTVVHQSDSPAFPFIIYYINDGDRM